MSRTIKGWRGNTWVACDALAVCVFFGAEEMTRPVPVCQAHFDLGEKVRAVNNPNWRERNLYRNAIAGEVCCQPKLDT